MSTEENEIKEPEKQYSGADEELLKKLDSLEKHIGNLESKLHESEKSKKQFSKDEIRELAEKRVIDRQIEEETKIIEQERIERNKPKLSAEQALNERNTIEKVVLEEFKKGMYYRSQLENADKDPAFADLLSRALLRDWSKIWGIPEDVIDNSNPWNFRENVLKSLKKIDVK